MDERKSDERKADHLKLAPPSLKAAVRRARVESAEQSEAIDDLRQSEVLRLEALEEAIRPVLEQAPEGVELFDVGLARGEHPRLFLDMISFVEMGHDRRTYRFFQDTRYGRVLIAESANVDRTVAALTNYIARRLVERERALAADSRGRPDAAAQAATQKRASAISKGVEASRNAPATSAAATARGGWLRVIAELFVFFLTSLGACTAIGLVALALWRAWLTWGRALWAAKFGSAPF